MDCLLPTRAKPKKDRNGTDEVRGENAVSDITNAGSNRLCDVGIGGLGLNDREYKHEGKGVEPFHCRTFTP